MHSLKLLAVAAFVGAGSPAFAQGRGAADEAPAVADPAVQKAVDEGYKARCEASAPKDLCFCVISVADSQLADPVERQVFYDFMMGDVDKAKTARSMFPPNKNMKFNLALQKADVLLGERCDKLKPQPKDEPQGQPAPQGGQKLP